MSLTPKNVAIGVILAGFLMPLGAQATLLTNGGAEAGALATGWTRDISGATSGNTTIIERATSQPQGGSPPFPTVTPKEGTWFWNFSDQATKGTSGGLDETISMSQTGTSGLTAGNILQLTGFFQNATLDYGEVVLSITGGGGPSVTTGILDLGDCNLSTTPDCDWAAFSVELLVPTGATSWEVELFGTDKSSTFTNVFYDDLVLNSVPSVPEPMTLALLGLGLAGLGFRRRRLNA